MRSSHRLPRSGGARLPLAPRPTRNLQGVPLPSAPQRSIVPRVGSPHPGGGSVGQRRRASQRFRRSPATGAERERRDAFGATWSKINARLGAQLRGER